MYRLCLFVLPFMFWCCSKEPASNIQLSDVQAPQIGLTYAVVQTSVVHPKGAGIEQQGFCWSSTTATPTIDSADFFVSQQNNPSFSDTIKGLTFNTKYYIRAFAKNSNGVFYSNTLSLTTLESSFKIGQDYQGGFIFYIDSTGEHGLIACRTIGHTYWGAWEMRWTYNGTKTNLGSGQANTLALIQASGSGAYAAAFCNDLVAGGYDDWFLPSLDELMLLRENLGQQGAIIGIYPGDIYWTSSELGPNGFTPYTWIVTLNAMADFQWDDKQYDHGIVPVREY